MLWCGDWWCLLEERLVWSRLRLAICPRGEVRQSEPVMSRVKSLQRTGLSRPGISRQRGEERRRGGLRLSFTKPAVHSMFAAQTGLTECVFFGWEMSSVLMFKYFSLQDRQSGSLAGDHVKQWMVTPRIAHHSPPAGSSGMWLQSLGHYTTHFTQSNIPSKPGPDFPRPPPCSGAERSQFLMKSLSVTAIYHQPHS